MATPNIPIVNAGVDYVSGLELARASATTLTLSAGAARDSSLSNDIELSAAVTINAANNGANGLDSGSLDNNLWYDVFVIDDSTKYNAAAGLLSLSSNSSPTLPAGYDMYRRVGHVETDGSAEILAFSQYGSGNIRQYLWEASQAIVTVTTSNMPTTLTAQSLAAGVPPIKCEAILDVTFTAASATNVLTLAPHETSATAAGIIRFGYGVAAAQVGMARVIATLNSGAPSIKYESSNANDAMTLAASGWVEDLLA